MEILSFPFLYARKISLALQACALILPLSHGSLDFSRNSRFLDSGSICNYFASHFGNYSISHLDFEAFC